MPHSRHRESLPANKSSINIDLIFRKAGNVQPHIYAMGLFLFPNKFCEAEMGVVGLKPLTL